MSEAPLHRILPTGPNPETADLAGPVGVIGAGLAGLTAARVLSDYGLDVTVFDKGRRPGGRANTREHGDHHFDHGAQFFTARDPVVRRWVESWVDEGVVAEWTGRLIRATAAGEEPAKAATRFVGVPGMIRVASHLAKDLNVRSGVRIQAIERAGDSWTLQDEDGDAQGAFGRVVVAVPAPQTVPLLTEVPAIQAVTEGVVMDPCMVGMFAFDTAVPVDFDGAFISGGPLSWVARDSSKPGRTGPETWVLHAQPEWTHEQWDEDPERVAGRLLDAFARRFSVVVPTPVFQRTHRWGFALAADTIDAASLVDHDLGIVACGDWANGGRVEGALLSGITAAGAILGA